MSSTPENNAFVKLGTEVYLRRPVITSDDEKAPRIILVFGWMGAQLRHVHKYIKVYEELYPSATQVIVMNPPHLWWSTESARRKSVAPAAEILEALGVYPGTSSSITDAQSFSTPRILTHAFSNGGSVTMLNLAQLLYTRPLPDYNLTPHPSSALIIDSAPGGGGLQNAVNAFTAHVQSPLKKVLLRGLISTLYLLGFVLAPIIGRKTALEKIRDGLKDPRVLPWMHPTTPRLYLYSKQDDMVPWSDTQAHTNECRAEGLNVKEVVFESSPHVAHARMYPTEYWEAIKGIWNDALNTAYLV